MMNFHSTSPYLGRSPDLIHGLEKGDVLFFLFSSQFLYDHCSELFFSF